MTPVHLAQQSPTKNDLHRWQFTGTVVIWLSGEDSEFNGVMERIDVLLFVLETGKRQEKLRANSPQLLMNLRLLAGHPCHFD